MRNASNTIRWDPNDAGAKPTLSAGQIYVGKWPRCIIVLSLLSMAVAVGGCTGTVTVDPTDLSHIDVGADHKTVEEAVGEPERIYESKDLIYASYRYNKGGSRDYDFGPEKPGEMLMAVVMLPLLPIVIPAMHAVVRPVERASLRSEQRGWLCVTYGEDRIVADITTGAPAPCEPPSGIWGDTGGDSAVGAGPAPVVDPVMKARIVAYLDGSMRSFESAMRDYEAKNPDSLTQRAERQRGNTVFSCEILQANDERIVLKVLFGNGGTARTMQLLVRWIDGDLEVLAHRDHAPPTEEK